MVNNAFQNSLTGRDSEKFTASLREGGSVIPRAANGIGIEEIKVTHTDGGGGRNFGNFRGSEKEYAMNYEPSRGGVEQSGTGSQQPKEEPKEETPVIEETVVTGTQDSSILNPLFNLYINNNNTSFKGSYDIVDYLEPESLKTINEFTKDNENVSLTDVYSILYGESSGGQQFHDAAKGPLQIQLGAFVDSQVYQKKYKPVPKKGTPERAIYMAKAKEDFNGLDELGQVTASLNYLEYLNKRFERNNKRKPTLVESATMYNQGYNGAKPYIANPSTYIDNTKLNTYINNVSDINAALNPSNLVPNFNQGGITTEPWGGANASLYPPPQKPEGAEPSGPKPLQQQMINAFSEGGISDDDPPTKKKSGFAPFRDIASGAFEFGKMIANPAVYAASKIASGIASGEGVSRGNVSGGNPAGMDMVSGTGRQLETPPETDIKETTSLVDLSDKPEINPLTGQRIIYAPDTSDTIVRQPETEQDYEERIDVLYDLDIENNDEELLKNYINNVFFTSDEISYEGDTKESSDRKKLFYPTIPPRQAYPEGTGEKEQKSFVDYSVLISDLEDNIKKMKELSISSSSAKKLFDKKIIEHRYMTDRSPFHIDGPGEQTGKYETIRFSLNDIIKDIEEKGTEINKETGLYNSNGLNILVGLAEYQKQEEAGNILPRDNLIRIISEKDIFI